jgi:prophage maintenance system killer protein
VRNGDLRRLFDDFPRDEPLTDQCALWVHAVVGKHFFPDANHRTAIATLRKLLVANGLSPGKWPTEELKAVRDASHRVRREIEPIRLDTIYRRNELFEVWYRFFDRVLEVDAD